MTKVLKRFQITSPASGFALINSAGFDSIIFGMTIFTSVSNVQKHMGALDIFKEEVSIEDGTM